MINKSNGIGLAHTKHLGIRVDIGREKKVELVYPHIVVQSRKQLRSHFSWLQSHVIKRYLSVMKNNSIGPHNRIIKDKVHEFE